MAASISRWPADDNIGRRGERYTQLAEVSFHTAGLSNFAPFLVETGPKRFVGDSVYAHSNKTDVSDDDHLNLDDCR